MNEIKAGDLVMVVRPTPCCGYSNDLGRMFVVAVVDSDPKARCLCGQQSPGQKAWDARDKGQFVSCLIRIDPPAQPESIETDREVVA